MDRRVVRAPLAPPLLRFVDSFQPSSLLPNHPRLPLQRLRRHPGVILRSGKKPLATFLLATRAPGAPIRIPLGERRSLGRTCNATLAQPPTCRPPTLAGEAPPGTLSLRNPNLHNPRRSVNNPHHRPRPPLPGSRPRGNPPHAPSSSRPERDDSRSRQRQRSPTPPRSYRPRDRSLSPPASRRRDRSPPRPEVSSMVPGYGSSMTPYGGSAWAPAPFGGAQGWGMPSFGMTMPFAMPGPRVLPGSQMLGMGEDGGLVPIVRIGMPGYMGQMGPPPPPPPPHHPESSSSARRGRQRSRSPSRSRSRSPPRRDPRRDYDRDYDYHGSGSGGGQGRWKH